MCQVYVYFLVLAGLRTDLLLVEEEETQERYNKRLFDVVVKDIRKTGQF